jgi:hypothetical protein
LAVPFLAVLPVVFPVVPLATPASDSVLVPSSALTPLLASRALSRQRVRLLLLLPSPHLATLTSPAVL